MSVFIQGTFAQLKRFAEEAGVTIPNESYSTQVNLNVMARDNDTLMHVFNRVFDRSVYSTPREISMRKVDKELSNIYRTLLVKCGA